MSNEAAAVTEWAIPGYTALKELGSGAFGAVILARHDETGTPVAIKYLRQDLSGRDRSRGGGGRRNRHRHPLPRLERPRSFNVRGVSGIGREPPSYRHRQSQADLRRCRGAV